MSKSETPDYDVLLKEKECEIRQYPEFFIVEYEDTNDPKIKNAFGSLFKYISDDNKEKKKIAMTSPVIEEVTDGMKKMAFVAPREFGVNIPEPNNPKLKVKEFETGLLGVIQYSGLSHRSKKLKMMDKLEHWLSQKGYNRESEYMLAFYNAPFVLPMFRKNEIWVRVSKTLT